MSLQSRLYDLISAIGSDIRDLKTNYASKAYIAGLPGITAISATKTDSFNAYGSTYYPVALADGAGEKVATLVTNPAEGTTITFNRSDSNIYTAGLKIQRGGTNTIDGNTSIYLTGGYTSVTLVFIGTTWRTTSNGNRWFAPIGPPSASSAYPPTVMARDNNGRSEVEDPYFQKQIANKAYVDGMIPIASATLVTNSAQNVTTATPTKLSGLTGSVVNFDLTSDVLTVQKAGRYIITGSIAFAATPSPVGYRGCLIYINGTKIKSNYARGDASYGLTQECTLHIDLVVGDTIVLNCYQNHGSTIKLTAGTQENNLYVSCISP